MTLFCQSRKLCKLACLGISGFCNSLLAKLLRLVPLILITPTPALPGALATAMIGSLRVIIAVVCAETQWAFRRPVFFQTIY